MRIVIASLVSKQSTYPNRNGNSYELRVTHKQDSKVEVSYEITRGAARRTIRRLFPEHVKVNGRFLWILGLLKGEGLKSVGSRSSMYRFCVVNNDPTVIRSVLKVLDESELESFGRMRTKSGLIRISYGPHCDIEETKEFWARELEMSVRAINMSTNSEPQKRAVHGSCMLTLSDVLLRRIIDLIAERVYSDLFG